MMRRPPSPVPAAKRLRQIPFQVEVGDAFQVELAGDFNAWTPSRTRLGRSPEGVWSVVLELAPGVYEYRLMIDGRWSDDPGALRRVPNVFGTLNCVLIVA
jgi:1,4-alpha-glucan branching enzyme